MNEYCNIIAIIKQLYKTADKELYNLLLVQSCESMSVISQLRNKKYISLFICTALPFSRPAPDPRPFSIWN